MRRSRTVSRAICQMTRNDWKDSAEMTSLLRSFTADVSSFSRSSVFAYSCFKSLVFGTSFNRLITFLLYTSAAFFFTRSSIRFICIPQDHNKSTIVNINAKKSAFSCRKEGVLLEISAGRFAEVEGSSYGCV